MKKGTKYCGKFFDCWNSVLPAGIGRAVVYMLIFQDQNSGISGQLRLSSWLPCSGCWQIYPGRCCWPAGGHGNDQDGRAAGDAGRAAVWGGNYDILLHHDHDDYYRFINIISI